MVVAAILKKCCVHPLRHCITCNTKLPKSANLLKREADDQVRFIIFEDFMSSLVRVMGLGLVFTIRMGGIR